MTAARTLLQAGLLALAGVGVVGAVGWHDSPPETPWPSGLPAALPELKSSCEASAGAELDRARECEHVAAQKAERYPFAPSAGFAALHMLTEAAECYAIAARPEDEHRTRNSAARLRSAIERDYRAHLTRYHHALLARRPARARADLEFLAELFETERGPVFAWVQGAERALELSDTAVSR